MIHAVFTGNSGYPADLLRLARNTLLEARERAATIEARLRARLAARIWVYRKRIRKMSLKTAGRTAQKTLHDGLSALAEIQNETIQQARQFCLDLALNIAREVLADEVKSRPAALSRRVVRALKDLKIRSQIRVRVSPGWKSHVEKGLAEQIPNLNFMILEDEKLPAGNAAIDSSSGRIELNWEHHLNASRTICSASALQRHHRRTPSGNPMLKMSEMQKLCALSASYEVVGRVVASSGPLLLAQIPQASLGEICLVCTKHELTIPAQVVAFRDDLVSLAPYDYLDGIGPGAEVRGTGACATISVSPSMTGVVLDALGKPLRQSSAGASSYTSIPVIRPAPAALSRNPIREVFATGIRAIDALLTLGYGQRIGLFSAAGVGKSTLLGSLARNASSDVNVIALVGERGREVREFIEDVLGESGLKKFIVVASTSDESPIRRQLAPFTATAIAEHLRDQGKRVLLLIDSITRTARAMRDVGLACGELPVRQGYPSSVYTELPRLLERAGNNQHGSITAIYTVLTSGEGESDPLAEEVKSILDGHIVLDSHMTERGVRPAIDPLQSISRLMPRFHSAADPKKAEAIRRVLARLKADRDVLLFGGEPDQELKAALEIEPQLLRFLSQEQNSSAGFSDSINGLLDLAGKL